MSDLSNTKYPSGLTYDESVILAEKYIEMMGGSIDTKMHYQFMAKKYLASYFVKSQCGEVWQTIY